MTNKQIIDDYPELTDFDIRAALQYASDRERRVSVVSGWNYFSTKISLTKLP